MSPVFATEDEINLKNQAKLNGDFSQSYTKIEDNISILTAKCSKNNMVSFKFDNMLKPISFTVNDVTKNFFIKEEVTKEFSSPLRMGGNDKLQGIYCELQEIKYCRPSCR